PGTGLIPLMFLLCLSPAVASGRAQVQQEPFLETTEGTGVRINCSHPSKQLGYYIHFYRQLPGRGPEFLALITRGSKDVPAIAGQLRVSEDGRWSSLWLVRPGRGDAAVYYCALGWFSSCLYSSLPKAAELPLPF
uniref:TVAZ2 protein n=1 Tax=Cyanoderma ruficeps TaxID=181631 RepID=A0A8C3P027_9PASS